MHQLVYTQQLGGRLTAVGPGRLDAALAAVGDRVSVDAQLAFLDEHSFRLEGEVRFTGKDRLRFRSLGTGRLDPSPEPGLRHGTTVLDVCDGSGRFAGARGRITSNFVVSDDGEITDHHLGVVFVAELDREAS